MLRKLACTLVLTALAAMSLSACGSTSNETDDLNPVRFSAAINHSDSILDDIAGLEMVPTGTPLEYNLVGAGLASAKAVYGQVAYNPSEVHLTGWEHLTGVAADDRLLLCVDRPGDGIVEVGWVLTGLTGRPGLDGDVGLCKLAFAPGPAAPVRTVSIPVVIGPYNEFDIAGEVTEDGEPVLTWPETIGGDGNNNGLIEVADLTPVGVYYNQSASASPSATDADYNRDGLVTAADITVVGQQWGVSLGGYAILSGPDAASLTELERFERSAMFGAEPGVGNLTWEWTGAELEETTVFQVQSYDNGGTLGNSSQNTVSLEALDPTQTVNQISAINVPAQIPIDGDGNYVLLISELSVDDQIGNSERYSDIDIVFEEFLQLTATVSTIEEPAMEFATSDLVVWYIEQGSGIGYVGNAQSLDLRDTKGRFSPINRGQVTVAAHVPGDFDKVARATFVLLSIESINLVADTATPAAGAPVQFTATGTFDWDNETNANEVNLDLTNWCNWGALSTPSTTTFGFNTFDAILDTTGAGGATVSVTCEFPREENITIHDNARRTSNLVIIDIS